MNRTVHFTVPEPPGQAAQKATSTIQHLGATLKSDSGHYVRGVIPFGLESVEVRVSWLPVKEGTQITILAAADDSMGKGATIAAERFRDTYLGAKKAGPSGNRSSIHPLAYAAFAGAVILAILFLVAIIHA